ncbi:MAG: hypothetical protein AVO34_03125 [Firmicutes bacterium ML8_F2]|nr:MAG: hypothetical protein AVO34_03125 [Firmicutes bacterium ML8_F2]
MCLFLYKRMIIAVAIAVLMVMSLSSNAFALNETDYDYAYSGIAFRFSGDFFEQREMDFFNGSALMLAQGRGIAGGSHSLRSVDLESLNTIKTHIELSLRGTTDSDNAAAIIRMEKDAINHIENMRLNAIAELNRQFKSDQKMDGEAFAKEMEKINSYFDQMLVDVKNSYSEAKKNVRLISQISLPGHNAKSNVGVEMDPGESGSIKQEVYSAEGPDGKYLEMNNRFTNTGGVTKRELVVDGFINEQMRVDGYAEVWDSTEVRSGSMKTGFWDPLF